MSTYSMKKVNGSECTCDSSGMITNLRDGLGRTWCFQYDHKQLVQFTDPQGNIWLATGGRWAPQSVMPGTPTPQAVGINHATGEIRVEDSVRLTVYMPDGTTQIEVTQIMDGMPVRVRFVEFPTRPNRSFIVVENHGGTEYVTWIQDAHMKLFKMEYEHGRLSKYTDMSTKPSTIWIPRFDAAGNISAWEGQHKGTGQSVGAMHPVLQSVELNGNRNYRSANGAHIVVDPTGTAFAARPQNDGQRIFVNPFQTAQLNI